MDSYKATDSIKAKENTLTKLKLETLTKARDSNKAMEKT